jgi:hypothetical protein
MNDRRLINTYTKVGPRFDEETLVPTMEVTIP